MEIYTCYGDKAPVGPNFSKGCIRENVKKFCRPSYENAIKATIGVYDV